MFMLKIDKCSIMSCNNAHLSKKKINTTTHLWYGDHSISISVCGVWEVRAGVQIFRRKLHTYIHLDYVRVEFLSYIKKEKNKLVNESLACMYKFIMVVSVFQEKVLNSYENDRQ